jgi:ribosome-binding protein aMBF1 (putative translation factor)
MTMTILATPIAELVVEHRDHRKTTTIGENSNNPINMCVGSRLCIRRTALGISRQELSKQLETDQDNLNSYETGTRRVSANMLFSIAKLLDAPLDYFFRDYTEEELEACLRSPVN